MSSARSTHCWRGRRWGERSICLQFQFLDYATVVNLNRTKSFLFDLKCLKIVGGWSSAPDSTGGAHSAPPDPLTGMGWEYKFVSLLSCWGCLAVPQTLLEANNIISVPRGPIFSNFFLWWKKKFWPKGGHGRFGQGVNTPLISCLNICLVASEMH